jgi:antitoxin ChpS
MAHAARLRKVGGSVMLAIPKPMLDELDLTPETSVDLSIKAGRLIIDPKKKLRHSLDELLRQCKRSARRSRADRNWLTGRAVGRELI